MEEEKHHLEMVEDKSLDLRPLSLGEDQGLRGTRKDKNSFKIKKLFYYFLNFIFYVTIITFHYILLLTY